MARYRLYLQKIYIPLIKDAIPTGMDQAFNLANDAYVASGIESAAVATMKKSADKAYYTLQGVKVLRPTKGIYIHGGKKIVIK